MMILERAAGSLPARAAVLILMLTSLSGCVAYYGHAVSGQLEILNRRQPIEEILADGNTDPALSTKLQTILEVRRFAFDELGLPDNGSYASYADIGRPFVVWNVVAADEFAVDPDSWCFLFVGCVSYRGYFSEAKARAFADKLQSRGRDVYMGGVTAYSTLGVFADPVLNTMLARGERYFASIIFHELAHQRVYIKNDSAFSEAFATVVEEYATERWLRSRNGAQTAEQYLQMLDRRYQFAALVQRTRDQLRQSYARPATAAEKRVRKGELLADMVAEYETMKASWGGVTDYDAWFAGPLNNAKLAAVATYRTWVPGLRMQLDRLASLDEFFLLVEETAALAEAERRALLERWRAQAVTVKPHRPAL